MIEVEKLEINKYRNDIYLCSRCSYCRETYREKDHTYMICPIRENTPGFESFIAKGKLLILQGVLDGDLEITPRMAEIFFTCTSCGNCSTHCPAGIDTVKIFETFRCDLQNMELGYPVHLALGNYTTKNNNPYNEPKEIRTNWIPDNYKSYIDKHSKLGYFVGCTSSYRLQEISRSFFNILIKSDIDFTILGDEVCCGSPLYRTGQKEIANNCIIYNLERFKQLGVEELVFTCAGCLRTFKEECKKNHEKFKIISYLTMIKRLIDRDLIKFSNSTSITITYHDPCHLTKSFFKADYKTPRELINRIPGVELFEMKSHKEGSMCCGAGGGIKSAFPDLALKIAEKRIDEALDTKAEYLVSSCPFCKRNLKDAAENRGHSIKVIDIIELINERI